MTQREKFAKTMGARQYSLPFFPLITGAALIVGVLWLYWPALTLLFQTLIGSDDFSYGLLIPPVSFYIAYLKWPQIRRQLWHPSWTGLLVIALGLLLYILGNLAADVYSPQFSFLIVLTGMIVLMGGWRLVRLLIFPLALLLLTIPLPGFVIAQLTLPLQLVSSKLATGLLRAWGVPVIRQGNVIDLGVRQLQVVAACSGLRYILALSALGLIYCYFYQRSLWKAGILLVSLVPAAIIANSLRVAGMALFPSLEHGFWHIFTGWLIFIFCFISLGIVNWVLNLLWPMKCNSDKKVHQVEKGRPLSPPASRGPYLVAALVLVIISIPLVHDISSASPVPLRQSFASFPMKIGQWQGRNVFIDPEMVKASHCQAHLNAAYNNPGSHYPVSLWIAYYETQKKSGGFTHSPELCLPASGWGLIRTGVMDIAPGKPVKYMLVNQSGARILVYYWFQQRGRWLASEYLNKFYMGYDGLLRRRTDGALVRLITPAGPDLESAKERLTLFTRLLMLVLPQFIPD
jgi:exosortase D (VPLPA-CTERM-specific)